MAKQATKNYKILSKQNVQILITIEKKKCCVSYKDA